MLSPDEFVNSAPQADNTIVCAVNSKSTAGRASVVTPHPWRVSILCDSASLGTLPEAQLDSKMKTFEEYVDRC